MNLTPAQETIANDLHRFRVVNCGRRFGKTTLAIWEMFSRAVGKKNARVFYIAPTFQQARDICWQELKKICQPIAVSMNETRLEITLNTQDGGTSLIGLRGWEAVETLRGQSFDMIVLDEVASMRNFQVGWDEVLSPTLIDRKGDALFISTPKGFNHFYTLFNEQEKNSDYKSFHFTSYDNPHLPVEEIERERKSKPEDAFAQEYLADFRKLEGLVYKEFDRTRHLYDDKTTRSRVVEKLLGIDFGYTNPAVILSIEKDSDGGYWVNWEWYKTGKTNAELVEVAKTLRSNVAYPDPAEPDRIQELANAGLNIREVSKDIAKGIDIVRELFKQNRIHIHVSCINTILELETYRYPDRKPDRNEQEVPVDEDNHCMDAMRYALFNNTPPVEDFNVDFGLYRANYR